MKTRNILKEPNQWHIGKRKHLASSVCTLPVMASAFLKDLKLLSFFLVLVFATVQVTFADRGRPHIDYSAGYPRLLTDKNSDLRGVSLSWDYGTGAAPVVPTQTQLNNLANNYGLNCVHVYLESYWVSVGANASIADTLVDRCANAGLYVIFTIGCADSNGSFKSGEATDFWNFYAPRYKDRTHVIYEAYNEPAWYGPENWTTSDWNNQVAMYQNIRSKAPNTHILLFSFMCGLGSSSTALVNGVNYVKNQGVDFSNASIAFHGYTDYTSLENGIIAAQYDSVPLALTCTEWSASDGSYLKIFENHQVNWMYFTWLTANDSDLSTVTSAVNNNGIHWTSDTYLGGNGVTFYQDYNYGGSSATLAAGSYTMSQLSSAGVPNDWASSVKVPSGYTVTMYQNDNFSGTSWTLTSDTSSFGSLSPSANDQMSSCIISSGVANGTYKIISRNSGKAMDAYGAQTANGTQIIQWTYGGGSNQKWTLTSLGNNLYKIIGVQSGKSVDINNWGTANDTKVQLWDYSGGSNQQFGLSATDSGYYRITPQNATSSCLDVEGVSTSDGAKVHLWQWLNANNQQWAFQAP